MIKQFIGFEEAAATLGIDGEGLRQAFEQGLAKNLPTYAYAGSRPFLARLEGSGVSVEKGDEPQLFWLTIPGYGKMSSVEFLREGGIGDDVGDVCATLQPQCEIDEDHLDFLPNSRSEYEAGGHEGLICLAGYFRVVSNASLKAASRDGQAAIDEVAPESWWTSRCPIPKAQDGTPTVIFRILDPISNGYSALPAFDDLLFRTSDVQALKASYIAGDGRQGMNTSSGKPLEERERKSLLRIIRGLEVMAKLPSRGASTSLESQLHKLGFTKGPGEKTILEVLKKARELEPDSKT